MSITIALLVPDRNLQKKYKKIIENHLVREASGLIFLDYVTAEKLYADYREKNIRADIILLQASADNYSIMNKLRQVDRNCIIIYPAKSMDGILGSFESMPMAYVPANGYEGSESLISAIIRAVRYINISREKIKFSTKSRVLTFSSYEIDYFESQYRLLHIVKRNGEKETISKKLDDLENENDLPGFFRCHQSFLVNMNNIKSVDKKEKKIYFESGNSVVSSKKLFTDFLNAYVVHKGGEGLE